MSDRKGLSPGNVLVLGVVIQEAQHKDGRKEGRFELYLATGLWMAADSCLGGTKWRGSGESKEGREEDDEQSREEKLSSELSHSMREGSDSSDQSPKSGFSFS
jgi:hypothetical protein